MGSWFSNLWNKLTREKPYRILMVGLDAAGKTTILFRLKLGDVIKTLPTIGFRVEQIDYKNISFIVWDVGGQEKIRPLWRHYYLNSEAIIFVVDSADTVRMNEVVKELSIMLGSIELKDAILLILANKQDLDNALNRDQIADMLKNIITDDRPWHIQPCCAYTGDGIYEGLDWLISVLSVKERIKS